MIQDTFNEATKLHGHSCPGLAIGVRAAEEAMRLLEAKRGEKGLYCIAESAACYLDGIQWVFGATMGNKNIEVRPTGKTAFNFYNRANGKRVRLLYTAVRPQTMSRNDMIQRILSAPVEELYTIGEVHFELPAEHHGRPAAVKCPRCGEMCEEPFLRVVNGEILCVECAGKN